MRRSRSGIHALVDAALIDADGCRVALRLTSGQVPDRQEAGALLEAMPESAALLSDNNPTTRGYGSNAIREAAARYDKCSENYLAAVKLACPRLWCQAS